MLQPETLEHRPLHFHQASSYSLPSSNPAHVRSTFLSIAELVMRSVSCRGHTLSKLQDLRWLESLSMAECPCITDSSLASLSEVTSIKVLNLNHCDKITDNGEASHLSLSPTVSL